jgi:catechol 2,3-dioxygenase-like lactoylglutathione lyase family enzyme
MPAVPNTNTTPVFPKMHVSLNVQDIERSTTFYEGFFGVKAHKHRPGYANFNLDSPPLKLALQKAPASAPFTALTSV